MSDYNYAEALKAGQRDARACAARGESAQLCALDELLPESASFQRVDQGLAHVPAELIAGTVHSSRAGLFAPNFMPLAGENTEFAVKWERLCHAHLEEGIRDPISAYEYLNRYYVVEGNKRVSVLKFFDAVSIAANVTSILPPRATDGMRKYLLPCKNLRTLPDRPSSRARRRSLRM